MSSRSSAIVALIFAALLAVSTTGCDTQGEQNAQPKENSSTNKTDVGVGLDRSSAGSPLPTAMLSNPAGNMLDPVSLEGTPVLVNLWATWCAPCKREMPQLDAVAQDYDGELKVLTVSQDLTGAEAVAPYFAEADFAMLEPWLDSDAEFSGHYGQNIALPMTILYDTAGREIWRYYGDRDWSDPASRALVEEAISVCNRARRPD